MSIEENVRKLNGSAFVKNSYSVGDVCKMLGITRQSVYKLIRKRCFQAVLLESGYRIVRTSFDKWLNNE